MNRIRSRRIRCSTNRSFGKVWRSENLWRKKSRNSKFKSRIIYIERGKLMLRLSKLLIPWRSVSSRESRFKPERSHRRLIRITSKNTSRSRKTFKRGFLRAKIMVTTIWMWDSLTSRRKARETRPKAQWVGRNSKTRWLAKSGRGLRLKRLIIWKIRGDLERIKRQMRLLRLLILRRKSLSQELILELRLIY